MLNQLISDVEAFSDNLRRGRSQNVNDQSSKDRGIELAGRYFSDVRPLLTTGNEERTIAHDEKWQQLVRLAHGNNSRKSYVRIVGDLRKELVEFRIAALTAPKRVSSGAENPKLVFSQEEALILSTLGNLVPSAAASYRQGLTDIYAADRISFRGTAAEFRESLRETLDHLAPDDDVQGQAGFTFEQGQTRPTMKQKMRHVLNSRGYNRTQRETAEKSMELADELAGGVMRAVYSRASLATHVQASRAEVRKIKRYVDTLFFDLLEITQ
jgi:hypothetical protein